MKLNSQSRFASVAVSLFVLLGFAVCYLIPYFSYSLFDKLEKPTILQLGSVSLLVFVISIFAILFFEKRFDLGDRWKKIAFLYAITVILSQFFILPLSYYSETSVMGFMSLNPNDEWSWIFYGLSWMFWNAVILWLTIKPIYGFDNKLPANIKTNRIKSVLLLVAIALTIFFIAVIEVPLLAVFMGPYFISFQLMQSHLLGSFMSMFGLLCSMFILHIICKMTVSKLGYDNNQRSSAFIICCFMAFVYNILCTIFILTLMGIWNFDTTALSL